MTWLCTPDQHPQVFYHGTRRSFDTFRPDANGLIHFAEDRNRALEFATHIRGGIDPTGVLDAPLVIEVHLQAEHLFDARRPEHAAWLLSHLDLDEVANQARDLSGSDWGHRELITWIQRAAWQMMELPAVLTVVRAHHDALVMEELSQHHVAVFSPDQVRRLSTPQDPEPERWRPRGP